MMDRTSLATIVAAAATLALTAGCSRTDNEPGPGGVTVSEAKALDDAAEMLESRDPPPATDAETKHGAGAAADE